MFKKKTVYQLELERSRVSTSHITHLVMTLLTGVWGIVWIFAGFMSLSQRSKLDIAIVKARHNA